MIATRSIIISAKTIRAKTIPYWKPPGKSQVLTLSGDCVNQQASAHGHHQNDCQQT